MSRRDHSESIRERVAGMSQRELDEYLDELVEKGREDSREFAVAYAEWERRDGGQA